MAAPTATASSGFTSFARFLAEELLHLVLHLGHAGLAADQDHVVDVDTLTPASLMAMRQVSMERSIRSSTSDSNLARVIFGSGASGPVASPVM